MPGRHQADFRSGNWNEELGILLLKTLAAVAPVPRQDDFGIDAIATLLRRDRKDDCVYAEDTFYVQIKSAGKKAIVYEGHEIKWLKNLGLPFFIGVVDKKDSRLDLYPGHELKNAFISLRDFTKITAKLGRKGNRERHLDAHSVDIFLSTPLLSFTMGEVSNATFAEKAYRMLKEFLELEQRNVSSRHGRYVTHLKWKTNQSVETDGSGSTLSRERQKDELHHACETMVPGIRIAEMYADATSDRTLQKAITTLTDRLKAILTEKEYLDEEKTGYMYFSNPFE